MVTHGSGRVKLITEEIRKNLAKKLTLLKSGTVSCATELYNFSSFTTDVNRQRDNVKKSE